MVKIIIGGSNFVQFSEWFCLELGVFLFFGFFVCLYILSYFSSARSMFCECGCFQPTL